MTWSGLRVVTVLVALGVEVAAEWPVFGTIAVALAAYYVPDWSEAADRFLSHSLARDLLGFELIALVMLLVIWTLQRLVRSEEHTSELQSLAYLVCRLLLEKKNRISNNSD